MTGQLGWSEVGSGCESQRVNWKLRRAITLTLVLAPLMALTSPHLLESAASTKSCFKNKPKARETNPPPPTSTWLSSPWPGGMASSQCLPCRRGSDVG